MTFVFENARQSGQAQLLHQASRSRRGLFGAVICLAVTASTILLPVEALAQAAEKKTAVVPPGAQQLNVFQLPALFNQPVEAITYLQAGSYTKAKAAIEFMVRGLPLVPEFQYDPAGVQARKDVAKRLLEGLALGLERSYKQTNKIPQHSYLAARKRYQEFSQLIKQAVQAISQKNGRKIGRAVPSLVVDAKAVVEPKNTMWEPRLNVLTSRFRFDAKKPPEIRPMGVRSIPALQINAWYEQGLAAGNFGDLYDNRDNSHSKLSLGRFPQMSEIVYGEAARKATVNYGLNQSILYNAITIGNSSTAVTGALWRSLPRLALTKTGLSQMLYLQYANNQLYVYPEHRDHDAEFGDVLPANTPYVLISQGSSVSDQPFLQAVASILAAFKPKVKEALKKARLVMPTVQMIFRRGQKGINNDQDYLSGKAHPSVFEAKNIDLLKMIKLTNDLKVEDIPPMVGIKVMDESGPVEGIDPLPRGLSNKLFDTPGAVARVARSIAYEKRFLVQAAGRNLTKAEKLTYRWQVLRGDKNRIRIKPVNETGSVVEIFVPWHERAAVPGRPDLVSDRVDIGVFIDNGKFISAPAFISLMYPGDQKRTYNDQKKIKSVDYRDPVFTARYTDPLLFPRRNWIDNYDYDAKGRLIGWQRIEGNKKTRYSRHGAIVVEQDKLGRAIKARKIQYLVDGKPGVRKMIVVRPTDQFIRYQYANEDDRIGKLTDD